MKDERDIWELGMGISTKTGRSAAGFTLIEVVASLGIFAIVTLATVPLIATTLRTGSGAVARTVGKNAAAVTMEHIRGLPYFVSYGSVPRRVDVLDLYYPGLTPALSGGNGYSNATFTTTCSSSSTSPSCLALPNVSQAPTGYTTVVTAQFLDPVDATTVLTPAAGYSWNSTSGADAPRSQMLQVTVTVTWTQRGRSQTFSVRTLVGARKRGVLGSAAPPSPNATASPTTSGGGNGGLLVKADAKVDYTATIQAGLKDQRSGSVAEATGIVGPVSATGEVRTDSSSADVSAQTGQVRVVRPENPAPSPSPSPAAAYDSSINGSNVTRHAPPSGASSVTSSTGAQTLLLPLAEMSPNNSMASSGVGALGAAEAGSVADPTKGGGPVSGALPYARGYYDFNAATKLCTGTFCPFHELWVNNQAPNLATGANPLSLSPTLGNPRGVTLGRVCTTGTACTGDSDAHGEATISATDLSNPGARVVRATSTTSFANLWIFGYASQAGMLKITEFTATADCQAKADPSSPSAASVTWSAKISIFQQTDGNNGKNTLAYSTPVVINNTNAATQLASIKSTNPLVYDPDNVAANDRYLFTDAATGKKGYLVDWGSSPGSTTISADDRSVSAVLDGAIRIDTASTYYGGSVPANDIAESDFNVSIGKLSCSAEDYR